MKKEDKEAVMQHLTELKEELDRITKRVQAVSQILGRLVQSIDENEPAE